MNKQSLIIHENVSYPPPGCVDNNHKNTMKVNDIQKIQCLDDCISFNIQDMEEQKSKNMKNKFSGVLLNHCV